MKRLLPILFFLLMDQFYPLFCQGIGTATGYQTSVIRNPSFSGSTGDGILRLSYLSLYPGRNFNLHSVSATYDLFMPLVHGGIGFFFSDDYMGGIINDNSGGFAYSYHLKAGRDFFINAGLSASFIHRGINNGNIVLPDQIDPLGGPLLPSSEGGAFKGKTVFDISTGLVLNTGWFTGALAITHLTRPDLTQDENADGSLKRGINVDLFGEFILDEKAGIVLKPLITAETEGEMFMAGAGVVFETTLLSINSVLYTGSTGDLNLNAGFSVFTGKIAIFYNYCINIASGNNLLPASLYHHAGISVSLNNVDKRKVINTINFPKL